MQKQKEWREANRDKVNLYSKKQREKLKLKNQDTITKSIDTENLKDSIPIKIATLTINVTN
jgi:hypothetical protein